MEHEELDEEKGWRYEAKKHDGRLFPEYPLYCEGFPRPRCRGLLHLWCTCLFPLGFIHFLEASNQSTAGAVASILYLSSNVFCYGTSALYHIGKWSPATEIFIQKLDHCGIAILSTGTMVPVSFLMLPFASGLFLISVTLACCIWTCYNIFQLRPSVARQALTAGILMIFVPQLYFLMTPVEFSAMMGTVILQVIGMTIFVNEPNEKNCQTICCCPAIYGYHEIFHIFVVMAGICVYICNYSVVYRASNGLFPMEGTLLWTIMDSISSS